MSERISGDAFGPVSLDYFTQRRVEKVEPGDGGKDSPVWSIYFQGGGIIHNYDSSLPIPKAIVGAALTRQILSGTQTRLQFGLEQIVLTPTKYGMVDENYTKGQIVMPQTSDYNLLAQQQAEEARPDDPSPERAAEGPSEEYLEERRRIEAEMEEGTTTDDADEADKVAEYERLLESGLSDAEARATVWPDGT